VDSKQVASDDAIARLAKEARTKTTDLRAVIRADRKVEHGRVIHVLDLLKRAGVAKIAFAVSPLTEGVPVDTGKP
jgi:biopolymer transport protein ExbD